MTMDILKFFDIYTQLVQQLFEELAKVHQLVKPVAHHETPFNYTWLDEATYSLAKVDIQKIKKYFQFVGKNWTWHVHGEHCLFICCDKFDKTEIEGAWHHSNAVDAGFFAQFLLTYPPAKEVVNDLDINYNTVRNLLESHVEMRDLYLLNDGNFIKNKPRIYIDFNEMVADDIWLLSKEDTKIDSVGNIVIFYEGMAVSVWSDDFDHDGQVDNLIAEGVAIKYDLSAISHWKHVKWCCRIDAKSIMHESRFKEMR